MNGLPLNLENAKAWHEGRKTQHRELIEIQPVITGAGCWYPHHNDDNPKHYVSESHLMKGLAADFSCYKVGEKVFIQEMWCDFKAMMYPQEPHDFRRIVFEASHSDLYPDAEWRPPETLPEDYSRSTAIITDIRVERIQSITEEDAKAEGIYYDGDYWRSVIHPVKGMLKCWPTAKMALENMLDSIYPDSWERNDYVWVYELKKEGE